MKEDVASSRLPLRLFRLGSNILHWSFLKDIAEVGFEPTTFGL